MLIITCITLVVIATVLVLRAAVSIPTVHYGLVTRWGKRTGRVLDEGLHFVIPFIDLVELFKYHVATKPISESFLSKDRLQVMIKGSVQWRPDKSLLNRAFVEMSEDAISEGLESAIKSELGIIAGTKSGLAFIGNREAIGFLINCVLRLSVPPHVKEGLKPSERLRYYIENALNIRKHLTDEGKNTEDRSPIEARYGIDIVEFALADVDFSPKTIEALEKRKQVEGELRAQDAQFKKIAVITEELKAKGLTPQEAVNAAQAIIGNAEKKVFSVEGLDKLLSGLK